MLKPINSSSLFIFFCSFQVAEGFIDGVNQRAGPRDVLFENLPVRLESGDFFRIVAGSEFP